VRMFLELRSSVTLPLEVVDVPVDTSQAVITGGDNKGGSAALVVYWILNVNLLEQ